MTGNIQGPGNYNNRVNLNNQGGRKNGGNAGQQNEEQQAPVVASANKKDLPTGFGQYEKMEFELTRMSGLMAQFDQEVAPFLGKATELVDGEGLKLSPFQRDMAISEVALMMAGY